MLEDSSGIPVMMESIVVSFVAIASPTIYLTHPWQVKLIPAKGSGKHKRSFQYFPSLPLNDLSREIPLQSPSKLSKLDQSEGGHLHSYQFLCLSPCDSSCNWNHLKLLTVTIVLNLFCIVILASLIWCSWK
jgi:hypothetical protein